MRWRELKHYSGSLQEHIFDSKLEADTYNHTGLIVLSPSFNLLASVSSPPTCASPSIVLTYSTTATISPLGELLPADNTPPVI